jgi:hypothetical protein
VVTAHFRKHVAGTTTLGESIPKRYCTRNDLPLDLLACTHVSRCTIDSGGTVLFTVLSFNHCCMIIVTTVSPSL